MPVPNAITDLSQTANSNSPSGSESPITTDNYLRAHAAFIALTNAALGTGTAAGFTQAGTGANTRTVQAKLREFVSVVDFGATGDGTTDDTAAIQEAFDYAAPLGRVIFFPVGTYRTTATVGFTRSDTERFNVTVRGESALYTFIEADHSSGAVLALNRSNCVVSDITLSAAASRTSGAAGSNYGLLMEAPDVAGKAVASMSIERVRVINQPSHGIVHVALSMMSQYNAVLCQSNLGHGFVFDGGQLTSRTNENYTGLINMIGCWATGNTGHGLKIGDPSDASAALHLRFSMLNCEFSENALSAGVRVSADEVWIRGTQMTFDGCAIGTAGAAVIGCIRFAGEHLQVRNHRAITTTHTLRLEADHVLSVTYGIKVDGLRVVANAQNPVVVVSDLAAVRDIHVDTNGDSSNITSMFTAGAVNAVWEIRPAVYSVVKASAQSVNSSTTLVDDDELQIYLGISQSVYFEAVIRHSGDATADIKLAFVAPSGATVRWDNVNSVYIATTDSVTVSSAEITESGSRSFGAAAGIRTINVRGWVVMSTTPGALKMQFAQNSLVVANTTVQPGSTLRVFRDSTNI